MILNIRGCNGSGKTTLVRKLIRRYGAVRLCMGTIRQRRRIVGYRLKNTRRTTYIVGSYETPTGGCDGIPSVAEIEKLVEKFSKKGSVVFEGAMISTIFGRWAELSKKLHKKKFIFAVLDTPLEKCIRRIEKRQKENGRKNSKGTRPFSTPRAMQRFRGSMISSPKALKREGCDVRRLQHKKAFKTILKWLGEEQ